MRLRNTRALRRATLSPRPKGTYPPAQRVAKLRCQILCGPNPLRTGSTARPAEVRRRPSPAWRTPQGLSVAISDEFQRRALR
eukprot:2133581-Alexandrium_andersonii.AAC.1